MSEHRRRLACHPALLARLAELRADPRLADRQRQLIDSHLGAVREFGLGALPPPARARLTALQAESASLASQFERLRREFSATNTVTVKNRSDLDGVPPRALVLPALVAPSTTATATAAAVASTGSAATAASADSNALSAGPWHLRLDSAALAFWLAHLTRATTRQRVFAQFNASPAHLHAAAARAAEHDRVVNEALADAARQYPSPSLAAESPAAPHSPAAAAASESSASSPNAALALSERRLQWLLSLKHKLMPRAQTEIAKLAAFAKSSDPRFAGLAASDHRYFQHRYRMHLMQRSGVQGPVTRAASTTAHAQADAVFLLPNVLRTLFDVTRTLFGLRVQCVSVPLPAWAPQISASAFPSPESVATPLLAFDLFEDAANADSSSSSSSLSSSATPRAIGRVYADLFARRGKTEDPCTVRLSQGRHRSMPLPTTVSADSPAYRSALPSVAIVCHIMDDVGASGPIGVEAGASSATGSAAVSQATTASASGMTSTRIPASALSIQDVKNLFHEWGHVLQHLVLAHTHNARDLQRHNDSEPLQDPLLAALSMSEAFDASAEKIHGAHTRASESEGGDEFESVAVTLREFPSRFFEMLLHDADVAVSLVSDASAPALRCEPLPETRESRTSESAAGNHTVCASTSASASAAEAQRSRGAAIAAAFASFHSYELFGVVLQAIEDTKTHIASLTPSSASSDSTSPSSTGSSPQQFHASAGYAGTHHVYVWGSVMSLEAYRAFAHASAEAQSQSTSPAPTASGSWKRGPKPSAASSLASSLSSSSSSSLPPHARKRAAWSALGARFRHLLLFGRPPLVSGASESESRPASGNGSASGSASDGSDGIGRYACIGSPNAHARVNAFIGRRADALSIEL